MKNKPLLFALILYCLGIFLSYQLDIHWLNIPKGSLVTGGIIGIFLFLSIFRLKAYIRWQKSKNFRWISKAVASFFGIFIFIFGFSYIGQFNPKLLKNDPKHLLYYLQERLPCTITGTIYLPKERLNNRERIYIELETLKIKAHSQSLPVKGRVRINIYNINGINNSINKELEYMDRVCIVTKLRTIKGFRNDKNFNYQRHLYRQGIYATGSVGKTDQIKKLPNNRRSQGFIGKIFQLRSNAAILADIYIKNKEAASLFKALIIGDRGTISNETNAILKRTGTTHLLAVSGLHLGLVLIFFIMLFKMLKKVIPALWIAKISYIAPYSRLTSIISIFPLCFYAALTGMRVSTLRALIMACLYLVAFFFDRLEDLYSTLAWAALIILIWNPSSMFALDFQLTFIASLGVIYYINHRPKILIKHTLFRKISDLFFISAVVFLLTSPLSVLYFHYLSPGGILFTPGAILFLTLILPIGLVGTILIPTNQALSRIFIHLTGLVIQILINFLKFLANLPIASLSLPSPPLIIVVFFYLSIFFIALCITNRRYGLYLKIALPLVILCFCIIISGYSGFRFSGHTDKLKVTFMDVGKGDAALVRLPTKEYILIDGGGINDQAFDIGENITTPYLWSKGIRKIKAVVISHPHPDHIKGLYAIIRNFYIEEIWIGPGSFKDKRYKELSLLASEKGIKERILHSGDRIKITPVFEIICLHPPDYEKIMGPRGKNSRINNNSLVLKIIYDKISILFTGDIEIEAEEYMVQNIKQLELASNILKSPHHGSKYSNSLPFLKTISPEITIISSRQISWFPLPSPDIIRRLESLQSIIYQTEKDGAVTIETDGKTYIVSTWEEYQSILPIKRWLKIW